MSTLNVTTIQHSSNTGDPNIELFSDGSTSIKNFDVTEINGGPLRGFTNKLINADFAINQRGSVFTFADSSTARTDYTLDRWFGAHKAIEATVRQDIQTPGILEARYGLRTAITNGGGGSDNYLAIVQKIEDCTTIQGDFAISFTAKASKSMSIGIEITRSYGSGGSSTDTALFTEKVDLTTSFERYTLTGTMPSLDGKDLSDDEGETGDIGLFIWMTAGSDFNDRASSIGLQTGTIDLVDVQFEQSSTASAFERRPVYVELPFCQRYFYHMTVTGMNDRNYAKSPYNFGTPPNKSMNSYEAFPVTMRVSPTISATNASDSLTRATGSQMGVGFKFTDDTDNATASVSEYSADAEL